MGDVVRFGKPGGEPNDATGRERRRERFEALERVLKTKPQLGRQDQFLVAEALWKLLNRAKEQNLRQAQVLVSAGIGSAGDSTKHLTQYALDPSWPRERKEKARLNKKPHRYKEIAEAAARLAGWDARDAVLEVFKETTLAGTRPGQEAAPEYEALARTLREIADTVAAKHGLQEYFQKVAKSKPTLRVLNEEEDGPKDKLEPDEIEIYFNDQSDGLDWPVSFYDPSGDRDLHDFGFSIPPYPALVFGKWSIGDEFRVSIEHGDRKDRSVGPTSETRTVLRGEYTVELRLCIVPEGQEMIPTGALRVTSVFRSSPIWVDGDRPGPFTGFDDLVSHPDDEIEGFFGVMPDKQNVWCHLRRVSGTEPRLIAQYGLAKARGCRFLPLTGQVCQDWLGIDVEDDSWGNRDQPLHMRVLGPSLFWNELWSGISPFPTVSIASAVDRCLSGAGQWDLLTLLDERAARLVELLSDAQEFSQEARATGYKKLATRLRAMREGNEDG